MKSMNINGQQNAAGASSVEATEQREVKDDYVFTPEQQLFYDTFNKYREHLSELAESANMHEKDKVALLMCGLIDKHDKFKCDTSTITSADNLGLMFKSLFKDNPGIMMIALHVISKLLK